MKLRNKLILFSVLVIMCISIFSCQTRGIYKVTFLDEDNSIISVQHVRGGEDVFGPIINRNGYSYYYFYKWDKPLVNITSSITVKAIYKYAFDYVIVDGHVEITEYNNINRLSEVIVPDTLEGFPVEIIKTGAFSFLSNTITSLVIPDSVNTIESGALRDFERLKILTVPFVGKTRESTDYEGLFGYIFGPKSQTPPVWNVESANNHYAIPHLETVNITDAFSIPYHAFSYTNFSYISLNDSLEEISDGAFYESNIQYINIPNSVTSIGIFAFSSCEFLTDITLSNSLTILKRNTFSNSKNLESIILPDSITIIEESAFSSCIKLKYIYLSKNIISIGQNTFFGCSSLTEIDLPKGLTRIEDLLFYYCNNLKTVNIPDTVNYIGLAAFAGCYSLETIIIESNITYVDKDAFDLCYSLTIYLEQDEFPLNWGENWCGIALVILYY